MVYYYIGYWNIQNALYIFGNFWGSRGLGPDSHEKTGRKLSVATFHRSKELCFACLSSLNMYTPEAFTGL